MDSPVVVAVVAAVAPTLAALAQWRDMRRRTNGKGPLAEQLRGIDAKLDLHGERLTRLEERSGRTEERTARIERYLASEARAKRNN